MSKGNPSATPWHPVPAYFTDELVPRLKDTELRVLLVVLRQTWGWRAAPGEWQRKRRDWLSHRQLCRRTGRGSEAVSGAVAALVSGGLLVVEDAAGTVLATPEQRRRCLGRLYFRLGDGFERSVSWQSVIEPNSSGKTGLWKTGQEVGKTARTCHPGKPKTTKETIYKTEGMKNVIAFENQSQGTGRLEHNRGLMTVRREPGWTWRTSEARWMRAGEGREGR